MYENFNLFSNQRGVVSAVPVYINNIWILLKLTVGISFVSRYFAQLKFDICLESLHFVNGLINGDTAYLLVLLLS